MMRVELGGLWPQENRRGGAGRGVAVWESGSWVAGCGWYQGLRAVWGFCCLGAGQDECHVFTGGSKNLLSPHHLFFSIANVEPGWQGCEGGPSSGGEGPNVPGPGLAVSSISGAEWPGGGSGRA